MSIHTAAQSITKKSLIAVRPCDERRRRHAESPPATLMSISACPSMRPSAPRSASRLASSRSCTLSARRNSIAISAIITGPPTYSATVNCQPIRTARMIPSSSTRLVEANWNAIALVKSAPLRNSERASATAA